MISLNSGEASTNRSWITDLTRVHPAASTHYLTLATIKSLPRLSASQILIDTTNPRVHHLTLEEA